MDRKQTRVMGLNERKNVNCVRVQFACSARECVPFSLINLIFMVVDSKDCEHGDVSHACVCVYIYLRVLWRNDDDGRRRLEWRQRDAAASHDIFHFGRLVFGGRKQMNGIDHRVVVGRKNESKNIVNFCSVKLGQLDRLSPRVNGHKFR